MRAIGRLGSSHNKARYLLLIVSLFITNPKSAPFRPIVKNCHAVTEWSLDGVSPAEKQHFIEKRRIFAELNTGHYCSQEPLSTPLCARLSLETKALPVHCQLVALHLQQLIDAERNEEAVKVTVVNSVEFL